MTLPVIVRSNAVPESCSWCSFVMLVYVLYINLGIIVVSNGDINGYPGITHIWWGIAHGFTKWTPGLTHDAIERELLSIKPLWIDHMVSPKVSIIIYPDLTHCVTNCWSGLAHGLTNLTPDLTNSLSGHHEWITWSHSWRSKWCTCCYSWFHTLSTWSHSRRYKWHHSSCFM